MNSEHRVTESAGLNDEHKISYMILIKCKSDEWEHESKGFFGGEHVRAERIFICDHVRKSRHSIDGKKKQTRTRVPYRKAANLTSGFLSVFLFSFSPAFLRARLASSVQVLFVVVKFSFMPMCFRMADEL